MKVINLRKKLPVSLLIIILVLAACSTANKNSDGLLNPTSESESATNTSPPPSSSTPTSTPMVIPTETPTGTPTLTSTPEPTYTETVLPTETPIETPTVTVIPAAESIPGNAIMIYLILPDTGGPIACGDSLIAIDSGLTATGDVKKDVTAAFNRLFAIGVKNVNGYYNALYQSRLNADRIVFDKSKKDITIYSDNKFVRPRTDCDHLRYRAQVWATITQFPEIKRAHVYVKGAKLGDLLAVNDK